MAFGNMIGKRDTRVTANNVTQDDTGITPQRTLGPDINFWADVTEMPSPVSPVNGKRLNIQKIKLLCDSRDVAQVGINSQISIDTNSSLNYQVEDKYDEDFRFTTCLIAFAIPN